MIRTPRAKAWQGPFYDLIRVNINKVILPKKLSSEKTFEILWEYEQHSSKLSKQRAGNEGLISSKQWEIFYVC